MTDHYIDMQDQSQRMSNSHQTKDDAGDAESDGAHIHPAIIATSGSFCLGNRVAAGAPQGRDLK